MLTKTNSILVLLVTQPLHHTMHRVDFSLKQNIFVLGIKPYVYHPIGPSTKPIHTTVVSIELFIIINTHFICNQRTPKTKQNKTKLKLFERQYKNGPNPLLIFFKKKKKFSHSFCPFQVDIKISNKTKQN